MGTGLFASSTSILLLYYLTNVLGVAAAAAGLVLFLPKAWDVLFDPLVGMASDRCTSRWGRRQPFLVVGALLSALAFLALFNAPLPESPEGRALVVGLVFFLGMSGYAVFAVPYAAMPAEMSADPHTRTGILSWRMAGVLVGTLVGAVAAPLLVGAGGSGREGHQLMGLVLALLIGASMLTTALLAHRLPHNAAHQAAHTSPHPSPHPSLHASRHTSPHTATPLPPRVAAPPGLATELRRALSNRAYRVLLAGYVLVLVGNGAMAAAAPYFVVQVLRQEPDGVGTVFASLLLAAIAAMPLWAVAARRLGKAPMAVAAAVVFALALGAMVRVDAATPGIVLALCCALAGVGFAGSQLLPFSLLTDVIEADTLRTGLRREASLTGLFIAGEKAGLAAGPMVTASVLALTGFVASTDGAAVQPPQAVAGVAWAFSLVPAAFILLGAATLAWLRRCLPPDVPGQDESRNAHTRRSRSPSAS